VSENVNAEPFAVPWADPGPASWQSQCIDDAKVAGISADGLDAAVKDMTGGGEDLFTFMAIAIKSAPDAT
jgi:hypothetical protein